MVKFYKISTDSCLGTKTIAILEIKNRALLGSYPGYISIFYINIITNFQFTNIDTLPSCDLYKLTKGKLDNFFNEELSFSEKITYYFALIRHKKLCKQRQRFINNINNGN